MPLNRSKGPGLGDITLSKVGNPFVLSKRKPLDDGDLRFDPKEFQRWLDELPVADPVHAAKELYERLREINSLDIPVSDRLQILESCMPRLISSIELLSGQVAGQSYPLSRHAQMLVSLISALYSLSAKAYKVVLDQYAHDSIAGSLLHKHNRRLALHRALYLLGRVQLHVYQYYQPVPEYLWHEIHFIHQYGWSQHLVDHKLGCAGEQVSGEYSASDLYKLALLLSLAGPYRLLQGEIGQVYLALLSRVSKSKLLELGKEDSEEALFIVDFAKDMGARHRNPNQDNSVGKGWLLDASQLSLVLAQELDGIDIEMGAVRPHETSDELSPELLAKMMLAWGIGMQRISSRDDRLGKVTLVNGLEPLYEAMDGAPVPTHLEWSLDEPILNPLMNRILK